MERIPTLHTGCLAYLDTLTAGLVKCRVLKVMSTFAVVQVTATKWAHGRIAYAKGEVPGYWSHNLVVPREAVTGTTRQSGPRVHAYSVVVDR
jgi:hypothetical protein